jgi:sigma-B regulation protein RsbU (phosphoserine phosphatase)
MWRPRILVVDDDAAHRRTVDRVLGDTYEVTLASGSEEALRKTGGERFELALLDLRMPGMDGFDLMDRLKTDDPGLDVILMTGSVSDTDARLIRAMHGGAFYFVQKPFHRDVLLALVQRCLETRRLLRADREHAERLAAELEAARRFQQSLLPETSFSYSGIEGAALYEPCMELGGDLFEHAPAGKGAAILVADVAGKGVSAAMFTGMLKQAFRASAEEAFAPALVLQRAFAASRVFADGRYLTACAARMDAGSERLELVITAGHPPAYLLRANGDLERLEASADPLHPALPTWRFEQRTHRFSSGDLFFAFTDGLIESRRAEGDELFGVERLEETLRSAPRDSASGLITTLRGALSVFQDGRPPEDDLTLLSARRT